MQYIKERGFFTLLGINCLTIILAYWQNWGLVPLLYIFWGQSMIIGGFNAYDIFTLKEFSTDNFTMNNQKVDPTPKTKRSVGFFFLMHFGFFHFMYFIFIPVVAATLGKEWGDSFDYREFRLQMFLVMLNILMFFITYLQEFLYKRKHYRLVPNIGTLMFYPYIRIIPMHTIVIGAATLGSKQSVMLFLLLKLLSDSAMYIVDRYRYRNATFIP